MSTFSLNVVPIEDVGAAAPPPIDRKTRARVFEIVDDVRSEGLSSLRRYVNDLDGRGESAPLLFDRDALEAALSSTPPSERMLLERTAARIERFACAQVASLRSLDVGVPGGRAGHDIAPVRSAGCYAPGGRYPLPSSVLMTAVTAKAAGVERVIVATPRPSPTLLAAAAIAGADAVLAAGGAHGIAALAYGCESVLERVDLIVGPGNRWVTAAKQLVFGDVGIDLPAGPSELLVVADGSADPDVVAADLLAQAEHDPDARAGLIALDQDLPARVEERLRVRLAALSTRDVARAALDSSFAAIAPDLAAAARAVDALAPEHLQLSMRAPLAFKNRLGHFGAAFLGESSAEVFGDYGVGPNHVLPTGGAARYSGGLSALTFLRVRTWLAVDSPESIAPDCVALANIEGLPGHAAAGRARMNG